MELEETSDNLSKVLNEALNILDTDKKDKFLEKINEPKNDDVRALIRDNIIYGAGKTA